MMLAAAMAAVAAGHFIFPTVARGKRPHPVVGEWGDAATRNTDQILHFWARVDPWANIAIACKPSALLVVDLDIAKTDWALRGTEYEHLHQAYGPRVSGLEVWDEIVYGKGEGQEVATYSVHTGSGGVHLYYRWRPEWPKPSQASIVKGVVDVRNSGGDKGGYVLAAGSVTDDEVARDGTVKKGGEYRALNPLPVADPPMWLRMLVMEKPQQPRVSPRSGIRQPGAISFSGLVERVAQAVPGNRNNALLWAARSMYSDQASEQDCLDTLGPAAQRAGLGWQEIEQTIRSAYRLQGHKEGR